MEGMPTGRRKYRVTGRVGTGMTLTMKRMTKDAGGPMGNAMRGRPANLVTTTNGDIAVGVARPHFPGTIQGTGVATGTKMIPEGVNDDEAGVKSVHISIHVALPLRVAVLTHTLPIPKTQSQRSANVRVLRNTP